MNTRDHVQEDSAMRMEDGTPIPKQVRH